MEGILPNSQPAFTLRMPANVPAPRHSETRETSAHPGADGSHLILAALGHLRRSLPADGGAYGSPSLSRQKEGLREWARDLGLLLTATDLPSKVVRGGQEHDLYHDQATDRYFKVTRDGIFGLSPGIDLALVSSDMDARRFHLWEASPLEYLERLQLQNEMVPGLNALEGVIDQGDDLAIVTSQPRFDIVNVTLAEIDVWFAAQGFEKITACGYYRAEDNLGVFDVHAKNVVRSGDQLIPFDAIPCHPEGGFLQFIQDTTARGHSVSVVRTVSTSPRLND
ncbi:MAG: hypothetical protein ACKVY0_00370 [Prosthecobacter sp.]|uniref:putative polyvalent protein kinase domain-containing protein n=1 Tax=Prosthecobacter sp. TaxID=1965333 RepID=UPI0039034C6C